ncbi:MAG TPA: hypothetical protein PLR74_10640, partial [Agriterribacter sp.]|nr:hypothetical protein [Agriterribacter sp.]
ISIPGGNAVGAIMLNPFNSKPVDNYGTPAGLMRFRIRNNTFGSQAAASSKVITFLNSTNNYGTNNIICGNTYESADVTDSHITKPGGGVVTYELNSSCALTGNLVEQNETFTISTGTAPGLMWLPDDYEDNPSREHPLIIFLHGAGQASGSRNNSLLKAESLPKIIADGGWNGIAQDPDSLVYHKFIVAAPQAPEWSFSGADLGAIINYCRTNYNVDDNRIYVTGLSAGGSGTISVGSSANGRNYVAAIVPVAAADFSSPTQNTEFDYVMSNDIKMLVIVGNDDSWKTFCQQITDRYNSYSPSPSVAARRILMASPAGHNANTWNVCFGTSFDASDTGDGPYNVYQWMLKYAKE